MGYSVRRNSGRARVISGYGQKRVTESGPRRVIHVERGNQGISWCGVRLVSFVHRVGDESRFVEYSDSWRSHESMCRNCVGRVLG